MLILAPPTLTLIAASRFSGRIGASTETSTGKALTMRLTGPVRPLVRTSRILFEPSSVLGMRGRVCRNGVTATIPKRVAVALDNLMVCVEK
jgi:hypothetical protein